MPLGALRTKNLDAILQDAEHPEMTLNRTLGATDIVMLGIGAIIGAGIFSTVGTAAAGDLSRPGAGAALTLSFVITAVVCGFTALCYAEFASMVPISGSAYTYSYATLGEGDQEPAVRASDIQIGGAAQILARTEQRRHGPPALVGRDGELEVHPDRRILGQTREMAAERVEEPRVGPCAEARERAGEPLLSCHRRPC